MSHKHIEIAPFVIPSDPKPVSGVQRALFLFFFLAVPAGLLSAGWFLFSLTPSAPSSSFPIEIERFSGPVEVYAHAKREWRLLTRRSRRGIAVKFQDKVRTGKEADIDFDIAGLFHYRLKEDSELEVRRSGSGGIVLKLERGLLLGETEAGVKERMLEVETNQFTLRFREAAFMARAVDAEHASLDVLEGAADVLLPGSSKAVSVGPFQHVLVEQGAPGPLRAEAISVRDWKALNEIRDIKLISVEDEREQIPLRGEAGNLFRYVSDEGAFYTPNFSFAKRRFYRDQKTGAVVLRIDYDVYPPASYSGMYVKTRDLDLSKFKRFSFKLREDPQKPVPDQMKIEFKKKRAVLFSFTVRPGLGGDGVYVFELDAAKPTPISEIAFVLEHQNVGPLHLHGAVLLESLALE